MKHVGLMAISALLGFLFVAMLVPAPAAPGKGEKADLVAGTVSCDSLVVCDKDGKQSLAVVSMEKGLHVWVSEGAKTVAFPISDLMKRLQPKK